MTYHRSTWDWARRVARSLSPLQREKLRWICQGLSLTPYSWTIWRLQRRGLIHHWDTGFAKRHGWRPTPNGLVVNDAALADPRLTPPPLPPRYPEMARDVGDPAFRRLEQGEIVAPGDEQQSPDGTRWFPAANPGTPAPHPDYWGNPLYRRPRHRGDGA